MKRGKVKAYKVWYSGRSSVKVRAYSAQGAKKQAWNLLGQFKYGWSMADFMKNATIERID